MIQWTLKNIYLYISKSCSFLLVSYKFRQSGSKLADFDEYSPRNQVTLAFAKFHLTIYFLQENDCVDSHENCGGFSHQHEAHSLKFSKQSVLLFLCLKKKK